MDLQPKEGNCVQRFPFKVHLQFLHVGVAVLQ